MVAFAEIPMRLTMARKAAGLTRTQASHISGISRPYIAAMEARASPGIQLKTFLTLAETYGLTLSELFGERPLPEFQFNSKEKPMVRLFVSAIRGEK